MRRLLLVAIALLVSAGPAAAGAGLSVAPVTLEFKAGARALATTVSNLGDAEMVVQVRLFSWSTDEAGDHHEPSTDIGFSPPIFTLAPGGRQTLRLALVEPPAPDREKAYRLYVDQLPRADAPGVQLPVRLVLPVFVPPAELAGKPSRRVRTTLTWSARRKANGEILLVAANPGARRAKLLELGGRSPGEQTIPIGRGLAGYVLAGQTRAWTFKPSTRADQVEILALDEEGEVRTTVLVAP